LLWCLEQEDRYELVEGVPVLRDVTPTGQAGASSRHDTIVVNAILALGQQLEGKPCRVATGDIAVRTRIDGTHRPDLHVICDPVTDKDYEARDVKLIVDVLSPSNKGVAWQAKLDEYFRRDGLEYLLLIEQEPISVMLYVRDGTAWAEPAQYRRDDDAIDLPRIGCSLSPAQIYRDVPRLSA
ncbi:MAG: Uma2 family endonuclease, partial [Pseudomonadota bacterium]